MSLNAMQTFTGRYFDPVRLNKVSINIQDIAHALSNTCRFGGHCNEFYSVAQHCVLVSQILEDGPALAGLMHDASEAYLGDMVTPLKRRMRKYKKIEKRLQTAIEHVFSICDVNRFHVKCADLRALVTEARDLMNRPFWMKEFPYKPLRERIKPWTPKRAEREFLKRFYQLMERTECKGVRRAA